MNDLFSQAEAQALTRQARSRLLNPDLVNKRFSTEWVFVMPSAFRAALDIQLSTVVEDGASSQAWTQGQNYDFNAGDTIYDTALAYEGAWSEALPHIRTCLQVLSARKAAPASFTPGEVAFQALHPANGKLAAGGTYKGTQAEFVALLRTGIWKDKNHSDL